jgi:hypothetical protein
VELVDFFHVVLDHDLDEVFEAGLLWIPAEEAFGLAGVAQQLIHFGRAEIPRIHLYEDVSS